MLPSLGYCRTSKLADTSEWEADIMLIQFILVCENDIMCVYVCLYKCTNKIDILSKNSIPTWDQ